MQNIGTVIFLTHEKKDENLNNHKNIKLCIR